MKKCRRGFHRCTVTKTCISTKQSRLSSKKKCRRGTRKCANKRCYGKSKDAKYQMDLLFSQI